MLGLWLPLAAAYIFFIAKNRGFQLDDALIYLRYIENALHGLGLVYNDGVRFNGLTSPLFSYLVLAVAWMTGSAQLASFAVSSVALFLAAVLLARLFEAGMASAGISMPRAFAWLGAALMLFMPYFYLTFGMETGLYTLLSAALIYCMREREYRLAGICAALLFLTRSEGALLIVAVAAVEVVRRRSLPPYAFATYVAPPLIVGCVLALNYFYYGAALPQSGMAKIWQGESGLWGERFAFLHVGYLYQWVFGENPFAKIVYCVFLPIGLIAVADLYLVCVVGIYLVLFTTFYVVFNIPNYHWYYSPYFSFAPYFAAAGIGAVASALIKNGAGRRGILAAAALALPLGGLLIADFRQNSVDRGGMEVYRQIGLWLRDNLPAKSDVAMVEIGTVGYYSNVNVVDMLGLVNPDIAKFVGERKFDAWLAHYRPNYILAHDPVWDQEISTFGAALMGLLTEDCRFQFPGYALYEVDFSRGAGIHRCDSSGNFASSAASDVVPATDDFVAGHVDEARVVGNFVRIYGWARDKRNRPIRSLQYDGRKQGKALWKSVPRADVVANLSTPALKGSGFSGVLRFDTYRDALDAVRGCLLLSDERDEAFALLPLKEGNACAPLDRDVVSGNPSK